MPRVKTYDRAVALSRAVDAFWATGYSATSMRMLTEAMGVAPKSLYADFGSKDDLFLQVVDAYIATQESYYRSSLGGSPLGLERIRAHFAAYRFDRDSEGCLLVNSLGERATLPKDALRRIDAFFERVRVLLEENLNAARHAGTLPVVADRKDLAKALLVFDQGLAIASRSPAQRRGLRRASLAMLSTIGGPHGDQHPERTGVRARRAKAPAPRRSDP